MKLHIRTKVKTVATKAKTKIVKTHLKVCMWFAPMMEEGVLTEKGKHYVKS